MNRASPVLWLSVVHLCEVVLLLGEVLLGGGGGGGGVLQ
jgi:hypothetical protein